MDPIFKTVIFTIFVPVSVTIGLPYLVLPPGVELLPEEIDVLRILGIFPIFLGAAFYLSSAWEFAYTGRGTPAPFDPPKILVSKGLYKIVRNPMYVGVLLILVGESLYFQSWALLESAAFAWLLFHLFVVLYEEPHLRKEYGSAYEDYIKAVPRWIPHLRGVKRGI